MTPEQKELFRRAILLALDANNTRFGLGIPALRLALGGFGFPGADGAAIADEVDYLAGKGFVEEVLKKVSRENRAWRITTAGLAFLDSGN